MIVPIEPGQGPGGDLSADGRPEKGFRIVGPRGHVPPGDEAVGQPRPGADPRPDRPKSRRVDRRPAGRALELHRPRTAVGIPVDPLGIPDGEHEEDDEPDDAGRRSEEGDGRDSRCLGGPRAGGYAGQHPEKISRLVLLAPAYNRGSSAAAPAKMPPDGVPMNTQSREEFYANWDRQAGCPDQYDRAAGDSVWSELLASDPLGATWGTGVRRAPQTAVWGWNQGAAGKMMIPTLMVAGAHDKQVPPERVRDLYADLGASNKIFVDLACSSHNAVWERNHLLLFRASLEFLTGGTVNGAKQGTLKLGYSSAE